MEIMLQSQDNFNEIASVDLSSGAISVTQKREGKVKTSGYFSIHDENIICFFRHNENLYFMLDRQTIEFQENDKVFIKSLPNNHCQFSIQRDQKTIFTWEYKNSQMTLPISAFQIINPMTSEEDFDIFVFIQNVINDANRRERVFRRSE